SLLPLRGRELAEPRAIDPVEEVEEMPAVLGHQRRRDWPRGHGAMLRRPGLRPGFRARRRILADGRAGRYRFRGIFRHGARSCSWWSPLRIAGPVPVILRRLRQGPQASHWPVRPSSPLVGEIAEGRWGGRNHPHPDPPRRAGGEAHPPPITTRLRRSAAPPR